MTQIMDQEEVLEEVIKREEKRDSAAAYLEKQKQIKKEISRLRRLFKDIDENKKKLVNTTIEDIAFMTITMQELRDNIVRVGTTVKYQNGANQFGTKQSPDAQLYLQMSQKQTQAMKILLDCMPKSDKKVTVPEDDFDDFVTGREDI